MWNCGLQMRVVEGDARNSIYPLDAPHMTIGRTPKGGPTRLVGWVHVKDDTVSSIQAELRWSDETRKFTLTNRSETNPTKVNEVAVTDEVELQAGDQIRMGKCVLDLQQADMRFGGRAPAREPRAETLQPPPPPIPPLVPTPHHGAAATQGRALQDTQKPARAVSLASRPAFFLEILAGPNAGQELPVRGNILALGGALNPDDVALESKWFDQEFAFGDISLPSRCLALLWKESQASFELLCPDEIQVPITIYRQQDGIDWEAQLGAGKPGQVSVDDQIQMGRNRFQIRVGRES